MTEKEILQLITPKKNPDRQRVRLLAKEHNSDLHTWCVRRRIRHRLLTDAVIAASVTAFVVITTLPEPDGHHLSNIQYRTETLRNIEQTLTLTTNI